ncbi:MAG: methionyl-tRNA formyltransferase [Lachnospiraceae bacterium]
MRVIFMGTPAFAVDTFEQIIAAGHEVVGVVTRPDAAQGRGKQIRQSPVKEAALKHGLHVLQPASAKDDAFFEALQSLAPDIIIIISYGQIIPKRILDLPRFKCINIHASLLPAYRGAAPIAWSILDGNKETGVTVMVVDTGLDTGDMIAKATVPIEPTDTNGTLFDKLSVVGAKLLIETLPTIEDGSAVYVKQPEDSTTEYAKMITKEMGNIDWSMEAPKIERWIRGLSPWPSAYTFHNGRTLKIWKASVSPESHKEEAGTVVQVDAQGIHVATGAGTLCIEVLQAEGKNKMEADVFLRGYSIRPGDRFVREKE